MKFELIVNGDTKQITTMRVHKKGEIVKHARIHLNPETWPEGTINKLEVSYLHESQTIILWVRISK